MLKKLLFFIALSLSIMAMAQDSIRFKSVRPQPKKKDSITLSSRDYKYISIDSDRYDPYPKGYVQAKSCKKRYVCLRTFPKYGTNLYYVGL